MTDIIVYSGQSDVGDRLSLPPYPATARTTTRATASTPGIGINRRALLATATAFALVPAICRPAFAIGLSEDAREWGTFHERFVTTEGRVVDTGNGGISHSEGQGIALLGAVQAGDRPAFDRIWDWTRQTLRRHGDGLHCWRYQPNAPLPVDDPNNATDGDLLIAFALFQASGRWNEERYRNDALDTTLSILSILTREIDGRVVLLPGARGFDREHDVVVNPSYYIFPAIQRLSVELPNPTWNRLWQSGIALLRDAQFGEWRLPADWVSIAKATGRPQSAEPAQPWPARFSFDAVRVPLYMTWAGLGDDPAVTAVMAFWHAYPDKAVPAWVDLQKGLVAPYAQSSGMVAVRRYVEATRARRGPQLPSVQLATDYYSAALTLLARVASQPRV